MTALNPDHCRDAVILLPGLMGSELVDAATGTVLWGLANPTWYVKAWTSGSSLSPLAVTEDERRGRAGRIQATRTLSVPAFAPLLRGFEPYTELLAAAKRFVVNPAAVREFAYDWRLGIDHNAAELAKVADQHLADWRQHPSGSRNARLVLIAHSMGGLVARYFTTVLGGARDVRATVTLGTPFHGVVKAVVMLSTGRGAPLPLPRRRLLRLARTLPSLYDLLPSYRCLDLGRSARRLDPADVALLGGDKELAQQAFVRRAKILEGGSDHLHSLVGVQQPTMQSLRIADGVAEPLYYTLSDGPQGELQRVDRRGDSTVFRDAASLKGVDPAYLPQSHSALAKSEEAVAHVCAVMTHRELGPPLGVEGVGLSLPDVVSAGEGFEIVAWDVADPAALTCQIDRIDQNGASFIVRPYFAPWDARGQSNERALRASAVLREPGMYRVSVKAGSVSAVSQLILAFDPNMSEDSMDLEHDH